MIKAYYFLDDTKATIDIMNVIPHSPHTNGAISSGDILPSPVSARTNQLMRIE
jgi:hypothetical protein